jgi:hypothetical protein
LSYACSYARAPVFDVACRDRVRCRLWRRCSGNLDHSPSRGRANASGDQASRGGRIAGCQSGGGSVGESVCFPGCKSGRESGGVPGRQPGGSGGRGTCTRGGRGE